jgi:arginyl-tRNA--protein-N-Asp/Glu arginylyltransferase
MFASVHDPEILSPVELDAYLAQGWFRMGPTIFTTNFLSFKENLYSAIWLRVMLAEFQGGKTQAKLFKANSQFTTRIQRATITDEKEQLFAKYKASVPFEASASLQHLLFGKSYATVYDTYEVNVHHEGKLIAVGYFDLGKESAMGISSFYHPDFKKYSLGKYLIYLKMTYCKQLGMRYFYPGYFVPGYAFFDYKLSIGRDALEYLQFERDQWFPIKAFNENATPLQVMQQKLSKLKDALLGTGILARITRYEFFDANLIPDLAGAQLFDFPLFLIYPGSVREAAVQAVTFDVREHRYHLVKCRGIWKTNSTATSDAIYSSYVLKPEDTLYSTDTADDMVRMISEEYHQLNLRTGTR